jgi:DUF971 family protein
MTGDLAARPRPTEIRYKKAERTLFVTFDDGRTYVLPAEYLRVESPSAEVQGHGPDSKIIVPGKMFTGIKHIEPVGNYAVRLDFEDGHDTGIFSWEYLYTLGREQAERWQAYLTAMEAQGLSRELG